MAHAADEAVSKREKSLLALGADRAAPLVTWAKRSRAPGVQGCEVLTKPATDHGLSHRRIHSRTFFACGFTAATIGKVRQRQVSGRTWRAKRLPSEPLSCWEPFRTTIFYVPGPNPLKSTRTLLPLGIGSRARFPGNSCRNRITRLAHQDFSVRTSTRG